MTDEPKLKRKRRRRGGRYRHTVHENAASPPPQHAPSQPQQGAPPMPTSTPLDALFHELRTLRAEMHHMHQYYQQQWQRQEWRWQQWARGQQQAQPQRGWSPQGGAAQQLWPQAQQRRRAVPPPHHHHHHHQQQPSSRPGAEVEQQAQQHQQQHQQQARVLQKEHAMPPQPQQQHNTQPKLQPAPPEPQPSEPPQAAEEPVVEFDSSDELPLAFEVAEELLVDPVRVPTLLPHALTRTEPATTPLWSRVVSGTTSLPPVVLHTEVVGAFREAAAARTAENVEACGELYARWHGTTLHVVHALMLPQRGTADTCHIVDSEAGDALRFALTDAGLVLAGWIHTHPQFRAFLSSVDMHTQYGYQRTQPAAIAVVLAPRVGEQRVGVFRLTQRGMEEIGECEGRGFHEHDTQCGALFCEARVRMAQGEVDTSSGEVLRDARTAEVEVVGRV